MEPEGIIGQILERILIIVRNCIERRKFISKNKQNKDS